MSILPMYRKCSKCKKEYSYNPSIGKMNCPRCGSFSGMPLPPEYRFRHIKGWLP